MVQSEFSTKLGRGVRTSRSLQKARLKLFSSIKSGTVTKVVKIPELRGKGKEQFSGRSNIDNKIYPVLVPTSDVYFF